MKWEVALITVGLVVALVLPVGLFGLAQPTAGTPAPSATATITPTLSASPIGGLSTALSPLPPPGAGIVPSIPTATLTLGNASKAKHLAWSFWGINTPATQSFRTSDGAKVAATPVNFVRYPGGDLGELFNYTSGVITNPSGSTQHAGTTAAQFVATCESISCHAIMQLPAEIDSPATAAYYAQYVVHTLNFKPAYWEIGNAVPGWTHFGQPWSQWKNAPLSKTSSSGFAKEVGLYMTAVKAVDKDAKFIAFGSGMGATDYAKAWISALASVDGRNLSGISVHSYTMGVAPAHPTWPELLSNLNGKYSIPNEVAADRGFISTNCPKCNLKLFITEANGAEVNNYTQLLPSFAGELYLAADVTQALNLRLTNIDWFCYASNYGGAWENGNHWQMQYTLFSQMFTLLGLRTVSTQVSGPSSFYASATYSPTRGLAIMMVNTNMTQQVSVGLGATGILSGALGTVYQWNNGSTGPSNFTQTLGTSILLPALSITILTVSPAGLGPAAPSTPTVSHMGPLVPPIGPHAAPNHGPSGTGSAPIPPPAPTPMNGLPGTGSPRPHPSLAYAPTERATG